MALPAEWDASYQSAVAAQTLLKSMGSHTFLLRRTKKWGRRSHYLDA
jgi:hypothetical protein